MIEVTVRLFAITRDLAGTPSVTLSIPIGATTATVLSELIRRYPSLAPWAPYLRVAVNCRYAQGDHIVAAGDELAIIPPVSGG